MDIDLSPLLSLLFEYLGVPLLLVLCGLVAAFALRAYKRLGLGNDEIVRSYLQDAMAYGLDFALTKARVKLGQPVTVAIRNQIIADATGYVVEAVPAAVRHFGLTPESVADRIVARLPDSLRAEVQQAMPTATTSQAAIGVGWQGASGDPPRAAQALP